jgi:methylated-DNA-[protein]-cysteine S-methyltransferase
MTVTAPARTTTYSVETDWGTMTITCAGETVVSIEPPSPRTSTRSAVDVDSAPQPVQAVATAFRNYFAGDKSWPLVPMETLEAWLDAAGVEGFRRTCLLELTALPYGSTLTYGELAELAGNGAAARAAGTSMATNSLPIVIPCHRVLPSGGGVGNYGFHGPEYKERLLELEGATA